jgi:hypothetical protein
VSFERCRKVLGFFSLPLANNDIHVISETALVFVGGFLLEIVALVRASV